MTDELIITSAVTVEPGDKVLLVLPENTDLETLDHIKEYLETWAPGADWLLISGVDAVFQRKGEVAP